MKLSFDELEENTPADEPLKDVIQIGRPTKVKGAKLDKKISCYFTAEEMKLIDQARGGKAKATFVRDTILEKITKS